MSDPDQPDRYGPEPSRKTCRDYAALQQGIRGEPDRRIPGDGDGAFAGSPFGVRACACGNVERQGWVHRPSHCWPYEEPAAGVTAGDGGKNG